MNTRLLAQSSSPFEGVLKQWVENRLTSGGTPPTLKDLQDILGQIDRWDVYDDTEEMMSMLMQKLIKFCLIILLNCKEIFCHLVLINIDITINFISGSDAEYYSESLLQIQPAVNETMKPFQNGCLTTGKIQSNNFALFRSDWVYRNSSVFSDSRGC